MKIGILTIAFNEPSFIKPCIRQFDGFGLEHLVLVSKKPWNGEFQMDETWVLAREEEIQRKDRMFVLEDKWTDSTEHYNAGLKLFEQQGFDWVIVVDCDEFYTAGSIGDLIGVIRKTESEAITTDNMSVYWKTPEYKIFPHQPDNPIIAIRTDKRFEYIRLANVKKKQVGIPMHHMSYVRNDEEMKKKIATSAHAFEMVKGWYENVWLPWDVSSENLHPVIPEQFKIVNYSPAPDEIRRLLI